MTKKKAASTITEVEKLFKEGSNGLEELVLDILNEIFKSFDPSALHSC